MTHALPTRMSGGDLAVATHSLTKRYGRHAALRDVALQVPEGAVYLLVGPNGAGKSTLIKVLLDLVRANVGRAEVFGLDARAAGARVRANVGYVPERPDWGYGWMRVEQLLAHHARFFPTWDAEYASRLTARFSLRTAQRMRTLSKGQARRVHLAMALAHRPPLLLLDEPTDGLDPVMRDETLGMLAEHLAETPTTVLVSTHHVEEVERLADHVGVLLNGELRAQASLDDMRRSLHRYLVEVPEGWPGVPTLDGSVLRRVVTPREVEWTVWGAPGEIAAQFAAANGTVRDVAPLSLIDATLALLIPNPTRS